MNCYIQLCAFLLRVKKETKEMFDVVGEMDDVIYSLHKYTVREALTCCIKMEE